MRLVYRSVMGLFRRRSLAVAVFQSFLVLVSLEIAWILRFSEFSLPPRQILLVSAPLLISLRLLAGARYNLLHGWWRYTGVSDALDIAKAVITASIPFLVVNRYLLGIKAFPLTVYAIELLLTGCMFGAVRLWSRILAESVLDNSGSKRMIIIGAGIGAQMLVREMKQSNTGCIAVGCLDDDRSKRNLKIHGVPVLGPVSMLPNLVRAEDIDEVLIAVPSATGAQMTRFVNFCEESNVRFRTVPSLKDLISGELTLKQVREVNVDDLLGREPVRIDLESVRAHLTGKAVMVTGAAGSIGSELCRQIIEYGPSKLVCVDNNETGIFYLERELCSRSYSSRVQYSVADIRNAKRMTKIMWEAQVKTVFHAAAYKHVPVMEMNVPEAVTNNVFGLMELLKVAEEAGCHTFVTISSDKAVNPTSVMGCTKRLGELVMASWPSTSMRCISVRFGNVLGSRGSVIPLFNEQIRNGLPLTITHPDIERFFMTITEAVSLVLQGAVVGEHRDILVLDMGAPIRILDLAKTLVRLSGKNLADVKFEFTGLRPGEKLWEDLFYDDEVVTDTSFKKIKRTQGSVLEWSMLKEHLQELQSTLFVDGARPIKKKIKEIIPEYRDGTNTAAMAAGASGVTSAKMPVFLVSEPRD